MTKLFTRRELLRRFTNIIRADLELSSRYIRRGNVSKAIHYYKEMKCMIHVLYMLEVIPANKIKLLNEIIDNMFMKLNN